MNFWRSLVRTYAQAWRFLWTLPVIAAAAIAFEGLQHIVEWLDGMYSGRAGLAAAAHARNRLIAGSAKVVWLFVLEYWVVRYVSSGSKRAATAHDPVAVRKFAVVLGISVALALLVLWLPELYPPGSRAGRRVVAALAIFQFVTFFLGVALTPWFVGAAVGDPRAGPLFALRRAWGSIWWGVGFTLAAVIPLMIPHYILGLGAMGKPAALAVAMLALDAILVVYLGVVTAAALVPVAERMARRVARR